MAQVRGLQCVRCGASYPADHYARDCPACRPVARSNLMLAYDPAMLAPRPRPAADAGSGLWRYGDLLPVSAAEAVSLGEGGSQLHWLDRAGGLVGLTDETRASIRTRSLLGRTADLREATRVTLFAASPYASFVTGTTIEVTGVVL